ncbi:hypothetical protein SDC9_186408 [bioreactor metagenome]|uniref:Uncharacterized protein n=1 Tax=bioreactor metagenome TaxID=1076179 RepID=A0A645HU30_9ZZZZ
MHPPLRFSFGHPLHAVGTRFKFQAAVCAVAIHGKTDLFNAAKLGLIHVVHFNRPSLCFGIHGVHAVQAVGKQRRFLATGAAANFHDNVFIVVFIPRQH